MTHMLAVVWMMLIVDVLATPCGAQATQAPKGGPDNSSIPPDILSQFDPGLVSGKRPKISVLKREEIFGLREAPRREADFVTLQFPPAELSTAERNILDAWIRGGHNRVLLIGPDVATYAVILGVTSEGYEDASYAFGADYRKSYALTEHPVNTDCRDLLFGESPRAFANDSFRRKQAVLMGLESERAIILASHKSDANKVLAGSLRMGSGTVYFHNVVSGPDQRRWLLNFYQWALDLKVPGVADAGPSKQVPSTTNPSQDDIIVLKNQDKITGQVQNKSFTIKTSYATLTFDRDKIDHIVLEGDGKSVDEVVLKTGDKLRGRLLDANITMEISSGPTAELDKDKVKEVRILRPDVKAPGKGQGEVR